MTKPSKEDMPDEMSSYNHGFKEGWDQAVEIMSRVKPIATTKPGAVPTRHEFDRWIIARVIERRGMSARDVYDYLITQPGAGDEK